MRLQAPVLGDGVVALRELRPADAADYARAFREDPELGRLLGMEHDPDERALRRRAKQLPRQAAEGAALELAITRAEGDELLGSVILHSFDWHSRRCEVGFWLAPAARGQGLGRRGVSLVADWLFARLGLLRLELTTTPDNEAAAALARSLGFRHEGTMRARSVERGRRVDIVWFGLLREDWPGSR